MYIFSILLVIVTFEVKSSATENVQEERGFNPSMDYWRQVSSTMDYKQYKSLKELIAQNEDTKKSELEVKVGEWAKKNDLEQDFKIFTDIQREYRKVSSDPHRPENTVNGNENEMTKIIGELATINEDQSISFKEACRKQNTLVKSVPSNTADSLGLKNLINQWCEP